MKHIKSWEERVAHGSSIYAKASALEEEVCELRAYAKELLQALEEAGTNIREPAPKPPPEAIEQAFYDAVLKGNGLFRVLPDGIFEHIPEDEWRKS